MDEEETSEETLRCGAVGYSDSQDNREKSGVCLLSKTGNEEALEEAAKRNQSYGDEISSICKVCVPCRKTKEVIELGKKKKYNPVKDVMELTKLQVASTTSMIVTGSLPASPQVPMLGEAQKFTGAAFGTAQVIKGSMIPLKSLGQLDELAKKAQKRRK